MPRRLNDLVKFAILNRECHDIVLNLAIPELIKRHVPVGEIEAHSNREFPSLEMFAYMSDSQVVQMKRECIPLYDVVSEKTRNEINNQGSQRWGAVHELLDVAERQWNFVPLHRELHVRKYMVTSRSNAMTMYMLSNADLSELGVRQQYNTDDILDLAREVHGSMAAIERAKAIKERQRVLKVARMELRSQRVRSVMAAFEAAFVGDDAFEGDSEDWRQLLKAYLDVNEAVQAFRTSKKKNPTPLKTFAVDLAISRMRDVLVRRRRIVPWPTFMSTNQSYEDLVWYDSQDANDIEVVRIMSD